MSTYDRIQLDNMTYQQYRNVLYDLRKKNEENIFPHFNLGHSQGKFYIIFADKQVHLQMYLAGEDEILAKLLDKRIYDCL